MFTINISKNRDDRCQVISLEGRLSGAAPEQLRETIIKTIQRRNALQLVLDCNRLAYIDSTGLGAILASTSMVLSAGGDLRLAAVTRRIMALMQLVRADKVLSIYPTLDAALASYQVELAGEK